MPGRRDFRTCLMTTIVVWIAGGCRFSLHPEEQPAIPLPEKVSWSGFVPEGYTVEPGVNPVEAWDTLDGIREIRRHKLEFPGKDSLRLILREYTRDYWAYAAFQAVAGREDFKRGLFRQGDALIFHHGIFMGELQTPFAGGLPVQLLHENLAFQREDLFEKPAVFQAFPIQDRIPHSEKVISAHFLGRDWHGPVFCVQYRCQGDTATIFRAFPQARGVVSSWMKEWQGSLDTLSWGREFRFQGEDEFQRPLVFWSFPGGVVGISDCFDSKLALDYAEKMKKMTVLLAKP